MVGALAWVTRRRFLPEATATLPPKRPEGAKESSRGLSDAKQAIPPVKELETLHPEGVRQRFYRSVERIVKRKVRDLTVVAFALVLGLVALQFSKPSFPPANGESDEAQESTPIASNKSPVTEEQHQIIREVPAPEFATETKAPDRSWLGPDNAVAMPLVFQELNANLLHLNQGQINAIQALRTKFIDEVGGTNQSPDDPAYLERWQRAQPEIDALLWFQLGKDIYQQAQLQAHAAVSFLARGE